METKCVVFNIQTSVNKQALLPRRPVNFEKKDCSEPLRLHAQTHLAVEKL